MHKSSRLRETYLEYLDGKDELAPENLIQVLGYLWNCTDILPGDYCRQLDIPSGSTYAQAVQRHKREIMVLS